jgi:DNA-binding CsgD family transcriptional regulator
MLTNTDIKSILRFQQKVYNFCNLETFSNHVLSILPSVVPSDTHFYAEVNYQKATVSSVCPPRHLTSPEVNRVGNKYFYEHPLVRHYLETHNGRAYKISDFLSENELHRLEGVYWQFIHPMGMEDEMIIVLPTSSTYSNVNKLHQTQANDVDIGINIGLHRTSRNFLERDRLVLNLLRPHLLQAYRNATTVTQMQQELTQLNKAVEQLGTIILTGDLKVKLMTKRAWKLIKQYFRLSSCTQTHLPDNLLRWIKHGISQLNQSNEISLPCLALQLEQEGKRLLVRLIVKQPREQYLLLLEEHLLHALTPELLQLLGLTKREAETLYWVTQDKSDKEIALILDLSTPTVKKHLEHIYQKLGVQTRIAAVMYALKALGMLNC